MIYKFSTLSKIVEGRAEIHMLENVNVSHYIDKLRKS